MTAYHDRKSINTCVSLKQSDLKLLQDYTKATGTPFTRLMRMLALEKAREYFNLADDSNVC